MKLFDSHCHLDDRAYQDDLESVISRAHAAGVAAMMVVGIHRKSSEKAVEIARKYDGLWASVGVHPHDVKHCSEKIMGDLKQLAQTPEVRAWGETGLDFNRMFSSQEDQEKWFVRQLEIADELNLPLIFHERDSNGRLLEILKAYPSANRRGVIHCFSGNRKELEQYLEMGFYIGITGIVTIKTRGEELRNLVPLIPLSRLLIETDAPYLTPAPEKNQYRRNEPAFVKSVFSKIAEITKKKYEELSDILWENTCNLFKI